MLSGCSNVQLGVNSFINGSPTPPNTCNQATVGGYQRVASELDWIVENVCAMSSKPPAFCL